MFIYSVYFCLSSIFSKLGFSIHICSVTLGQDVILILATHSCLTSLKPEISHLKNDWARRECKVKAQLIQGWCEPAAVERDQSHLNPHSSPVDVLSMKEWITCPVCLFYFMFFYLMDCSVSGDVLGCENKGWILSSNIEWLYCSSEIAFMKKSFQGSEKQ